MTTQRMHATQQNRLNSKRTVLFNPIKRAKKKKKRRSRTNPGVGLVRPANWHQQVDVELIGLEAPAAAAAGPRRRRGFGLDF